MATKPLQPIVSAFSLTVNWQTIYTVEPGVANVGVDAIVLNNYTDTTASYSMRIVQVGAGTSLNETITDESIRAKSNNLAPAMIGKSLQTGGKIEVKASANDSLSITITATIIT